MKWKSKLPNMKYGVAIAIVLPQRNTGTMISFPATYSECP
jgi:hypothetical protein